MSAEFEEDNRWQREQRDKILVPLFYEKRYSGRYRFLDDDMPMQRKGIDTVIEDPTNGFDTTIDEKIVRHKPGRLPYTAFALETKSCTVPGKEKDGWMKYGECEYLLYCMQEPSGDLYCHLIEFRPLKKWFWKNEASFPTFGPLDTLNRSMGRVVPIVVVRRNAPHSAFLLKVSDLCLRSA